MTKLGPWNWPASSHRLDFSLYATQGTARALTSAGIPVQEVRKAREDGCNVLDAMRAGSIGLIVNTPFTNRSQNDGTRIRALATRLSIPLITTMPAARAALDGIESLLDHEVGRAEPAGLPGTSTGMNKQPAYLVLSDGTVFPGTPFGAETTVVGEVVFNTCLTGYQEVITDPSYHGQMVCMTTPHIGNTGINREESGKARAHKLQPCWYAKSVTLSPVGARIEPCPSGCRNMECRESAI